MNRPRISYRTHSEELRIIQRLYPTQGKCDGDGRFFYVRGRLRDTHCPVCGQPLARTSDQSLLPRYVLLDRTVDRSFPGSTFVTVMAWLGR